MKKNLLIASSAVALAVSGATFAGGVDNMSGAAPAAPAAPTSACAPSSMYVGVHGGISMPRGKYQIGTTAKQNLKAANKNGANFGVDFGYQLSSMPVRLQLSGNMYTFKPKATATNSKLQITDAMVDAIYDFDMGSFSPYIGVGAGYGQFKLSGVTANAGKKNGLAYNVVAGVSYKINCNLAASFGYQMLGTNVKVNGQNNLAANRTNLTSAMFHSFNLGLRYSF